MPRHVLAPRSPTSLSVRIVAQGLRRRSACPLPTCLAYALRSDPDKPTSPFRPVVPFRSKPLSSMIEILVEDHKLRGIALAKKDGSLLLPFRDISVVTMI
eukprot:6178120-Pleurochrysis_carterae.AAC.1